MELAPDWPVSYAWHCLCSSRSSSSSSWANETTFCRCCHCIGGPHSVITSSPTHDFCVRRLASRSYVRLPAGDRAWRPEELMWPTGVEYHRLRAPVVTSSSATRTLCRRCRSYSAAVGQIDVSIHYYVAPFLTVDFYRASAQLAMQMLRQRCPSVCVSVCPPARFTKSSLCGLMA